MSDKQVIDLIRDRFDNLEKTVADGFKDIKATANETAGHHNERLTSLEQTRDQQKGVMVGGGIVVSAVSTFLAWLVHKS